MHLIKLFINRNVWNVPHGIRIFDCRVSPFWGLVALVGLDGKLEMGTVQDRFWSVSADLHF